MPHLFVTTFLILFTVSLQAANPTPAKPQPTPIPTPTPIPPSCERILIPTPNKDNRQMPVLIRWPKNYKAGEQGKVYRVLLLIPYFPETAEQAVNRCTPYTNLADERDWFIVCPSFKMPLEEKNDRKTSYYFPEEWSGKAVLDALDATKKKYPIDLNNLFLTGLSGGGKYDERFADWAPDRVSAVVVHSSGTFDEPHEKAKNVAWLITVGEADPILPESEDFVAKLNAQGALPILKTFPAMIHEDFPLANNFAVAFLKYYDDRTKDRVGKDPASLPPPDMSDTSKMAYVGDYRDYFYYPNTKENAEDIAPERRTYLPNEEVAKLWGKPGKE